VGAPIVLCLVIAAIATGYYYYRVTGNPFRMTYSVNLETYSAAPLFVWGPLRPEVSYHHQVMRDFYQWQKSVFERNRTFGGFMQSLAEKLLTWWQFYLGPILSVPLVALPRVVRMHKMRLPLVICAAMFLGLSVETWSRPDYFSPATCALFLVLTQCMRHLWHRRPATRALGRPLVRAIPVLLLTMIVLRTAFASAHVPIEPRWPRGILERADMARELQHLPGRQLVIVICGPRYNPSGDWVYNAADIDAAKVVWARDMGDDANRELLNYFADRTVWRVNADAARPSLELYRAPRK
jgi:hypothetical protein